MNPVYRKVLVSLIALVVFFAAPAQAATRLVLWDWFDARADLYKQAAERYKSVRPDVEVVVEVYPWDEFWTKLALASVTGVGPDLTQFHNEQYEKFEGQLAPFPNDLFPMEEMNADYLMFDQAFNLDGHFYYMPAGIMTGAVFYNVDLVTSAGFSGVPGSWDEMLEMARKLTRIDGSGTMTQAGFSAQDLGLLLDLLYQHGGFLYGEEGVTWGDAAGREAMLMLNRIYSSGVSDTPAQPVSGSFEGGQVAMRYNWTWYGANLSYSDVSWDVAPLPTPSGTGLPARGRNNYEVGLAVLATTTPEKQRLAFEFIKWLWDDDEFNVVDNKTLGRVPAKISVWQLPEVMEDKVMRTLAEVAPYTVYTGTIPGWTWDALYAAWDDVLNQRVDPLVALENSVDVGNALFKEQPPKWIVERRYTPPAR